MADSTGLLRLLPPRELRGVLAHEVAHLAHNDSAVSLTAGIFVQVTAAVSQGLALLLLLGGFLPAPGQFLHLAVLMVGAPALAALLQAGLMRTREHLADCDAARLTGDPRGLAHGPDEITGVQPAPERLVAAFPLHLHLRGGRRNCLAAHPSHDPGTGGRAAAP